jgi:hypothetical protein
MILIAANIRNIAIADFQSFGIEERAVRIGASVTSVAIVALAGIDIDIDIDGRYRRHPRCDCRRVWVWVCWLRRIGRWTGHNNSRLRPAPCKLPALLCIIRLFAERDLFLQQESETSSSRNEFSFFTGVSSSSFESDQHKPESLCTILVRTSA